MNHSSRWALALASLLAVSAQAAQYVYPAKGQTAEQQTTDVNACNGWAVQQTGFDPAKPPPPAAVPVQPTTATGTRPGAGMSGAAKGAIVGEVVSGDATSGAKVGAVAARSQSRRQTAQTNQAAQQQQQAGNQQQQANYDKARAACLEGKGYTIK